MGRTGFDQMMAGLGALSESMKQFATTRAINQSQQEINQLNNMEIDDAQKRQQMNMISQNLAMRMTGIGADPNQIATSAGMIAPKPLDQTDDWIRSGRTIGLEEKQKDRELDWKKALLSVSKAAQKRDAKAGEVALAQLDKFRMHPPVSKIYESLEAGSQLNALISQNSPLSDAAAQYKFAKLAQGSGILTDSDLANLSGDPSYWGTIVRKTHKGLYGTLPTSEKIDYAAAAQALTDRAILRLRDEGEKYADSRSAYLDDPDTFRASIRKLIDGSESTSKTSSIEDKKKKTTEPPASRPKYTGQFR